MFQFLGYNFCSDGDSLNNAPSFVNNITSSKLSNAIFDHFNVTKDITLSFDTIIPEEWDYDTILNAKFNGDTNAGNIGATLSQITSIKIKRRIKGEFDWLFLKEYPVEKIEDLTFIFEDNLNANGIEYEYAFVPTLNKVEGNYIINSIFSEFKGVFLGDADTIYKFLYDVEYSSNNRNQQVGTFEPFGRKYPVIISNGITNYASGELSATILNDDFEKTHKIDKAKIVQKKKKLLDYLTNHKAKVLKDWSGNIWLVCVVDNPNISYIDGSGMGIPRIEFNWTEIGDANNQEDLYYSSMIVPK